MKRCTKLSKKKISLLSLLLFITLNSSCYLAKQGAYLLRYQWRAESIDRMLQDDEITDELREFLELVLQIRSFAMDTIGLKKNNNYLKYVEVERGYMVDVVMAARDDSFEMHNWWFPFFGNFPYKGFFVRTDAERQAAKLQRRGYDVHIGQARAFSTLGFFSDPVYSFFKEYSVFDLANLIIHEQMHATIYLKNQVQFNEEIATFLGNEGGLKFVKQMFGKDSDQYKSAVLALEDYDVYIDRIHSLYNELSTLYQSDLSREEKLDGKERVIEVFKENLAQNYDSLFETDNYRGLYRATINNAFIAARMTYTLDLSLMYELYEQNDHDLALTVEQLKKLRRYRGDPKEFIRRELLN
ncbi:aminopeptidase [Chitinispirillales bacterium ANBcel5]|uniref:aminopeptidase n=1 Tax=Cellulosispirillum alkaliphilum TaxID=3039283 RepID=UPI002A589868|nr:aminopeptidase [Chitinispirillales bacterium ANBcel5]